MAAWSIPQLLFEDWLWPAIGWSLLVAILAIRHFRHEASPKPHPFFIRHKKTIRVVSEIFIVCSVSAMLMFVVWISFRDFASLSVTDGAIRQLELQFAWVAFSSGMVIASAWGALLVGMLSVFQSNITKLKRIILLVLCFLPAVFAAANLSVASSEISWSAISFGVLACIPSWVVNGPALLTGQSFFQVMWRVMCRLNLAPGDYSEWW